MESTMSNEDEDEDDNKVPENLGMVEAFLAKVTNTNIEYCISW